VAADGDHPDQRRQGRPRRSARASRTAAVRTTRRLRALAARALPSAGVLDKLIRQEGHLGRRLDLTRRQLGRLQASRKPSSPVVAAVLTGLGAGADVAGEIGFVSQFGPVDRPDAPTGAVADGRCG
jgi:hypothetical protein